jgi:hypothetical protein
MGAFCLISDSLCLISDSAFGNLLQARRREGKKKEEEDDVAGRTKPLFNHSGRKKTNATKYFQPKRNHNNFQHQPNPCELHLKPSQPNSP